jgi:polygalacturonase
MRHHPLRGLLIICLFVPAILRAGAGDILDVTKSGVVGDGTTLNTAAIQRAIDTCSAGGGGTLTFPAGRYLTGTIQLKDRVTLHLDEQAVILGSTNAADYRNADPFIDGVGQEMGYALIVTVGAKQVGIEGMGLVDGQGAAVKAAQARYTIRPFLVRWVRCTDVTVKDVRLANSGAWTMHFFQCRNVTADHVMIRSLGLANNDGIDTDSCETVHIRDCDINTGDDAICFKATSPLPCRDITVTGCQLQTRCNAIKFGTESLGDFEHIRVSHCQIRDTRMSGIALYSVDGSHLHDVVLSDITMDGITLPISIRLGARLKTFRAGDQPRPPGILRDITIQNLRVTGARQIGLLINGIPGHPVEALTLENIQIELAGGGTPEDAAVQLPEKEATYPEYNMFGKVMPAFGLYVRHVRGIRFKNVQTTVVAPDVRPEKIFLDVEDVTPAGFASSLTATDRPALTPAQK